MPKTQHQIRGNAVVYEDEMDGGEAAMERAVRRAYVAADEYVTSGTWEAIDLVVRPVVQSGFTTYHAVLTVEVDNG